MSIDYKFYLETIIDAFEYCSLVDENSNIIYISKKYSELLHCKQSKLIGRPIKEVVPDSRIPSIMQSKKKSLGEIYFLSGEVPVIANRFPLFQNGKLKGLVACAVIYNIDEISKLYSVTHSLHESNNENSSGIISLRKLSEVESNIISESPQIKEIMRTIKSFSSTRLTFLITGKSGCDLSIYSEVIHYSSDHSNKPLELINCTAYDEKTLGKILFGYEAGVDSQEDNMPSVFETAQSGTVVLEEINELSIHLQTRLLNAIKNGFFIRIGGYKHIPFNASIVCTSFADLEKLVEEGRFRRDLYYSISHIVLKIPPLNERKEDIAPLCDKMIRNINRKYMLNISGVSEEAIAFLTKCMWEGDEYELSQVLCRVCANVKKGELQLKDFYFLLPLTNGSRLPAGKEEKIPNGLSGDDLSVVRGNAEAEAILFALSKSNGNKTRAAKMLKISRTMLYNAIKKYGIA
jgi:transcriptional regulator with PAS, ATPase and Fis domain